MGLFGGLFRRKPATGAGGGGGGAQQAPPTQQPAPGGGQQQPARGGMLSSLFSAGRSLLGGLFGGGGQRGAQQNAAAPAQAQAPRAPDIGLAGMGTTPAPGTRSETREQYRERRSRERAEATVRRADQPLENPLPNAATEGHGHGRHGFETTDAQQAERVRSGRYPDDPFGPLPPRNAPQQASRFTSPQAEAEALGRGRRELDRRLAAGTVPGAGNGFVNPANGAPQRVPITGPAMQTNRPGGYGDAQRRQMAGGAPVMDPNGGYQATPGPAGLNGARVVYEFVPSTGQWQPVTYFPE